MQTLIPFNGRMLLVAVWSASIGYWAAAFFGPISLLATIPSCFAFGWATSSWTRYHDGRE